MINFGKWLMDNNLDKFGLGVIKEEDYILPITYENDDFSLGNFILKENFKNEDNFYFNSFFNEDFLFSNDERVMIPSNTHLGGLTPFFLKLDKDLENKTEWKKFKESPDRSNVLTFQDCLENNLFAKKGNKFTYKKFQDKIKNALGRNKNGSFIEFLKEIFDDKNTFFEKVKIDDEKKECLNLFLGKYSFENLKNLIIGYYDFLYVNNEQILSQIMNIKLNDEPIDSVNYYVACCFNNDLDLINDLFILYSKFLKRREKNTKNYDKGICSFCGNYDITYPFFGAYVLDEEKPVFNFNFTKSKSKMVSNSHLRLCNECNSYVMVAENNLVNSFNNSIMIIPKLKGSTDYEHFLKILNSDKPSFSKLNTLLKYGSDEFSYDLVVYKKDIQKGKIDNIFKYIENYQAFLVQFNGIRLYGDGLNYLFSEKYLFKNEDNSNIKYVNNLLDLEKILKSFFFTLNKNSINYNIGINHFYEFYSRDLSDILTNFDSQTVYIFNKYVDNIFSFIYEFSEGSLTNVMLNEIVLNSIIKIQRNSNNINFYEEHIKKFLNYYLMFKKEFLGVEMLNKVDLKEIKEIFSKYHLIDEDGNKVMNSSKISDEDKIKIYEKINNDYSFIYYFIGQFVALLDNTKKKKYKKRGNVFSNFILNCNKNNFISLLAIEVLQKNNYYIEKMNIKGKFVFDVILDIFDEKNKIPFDVSLILMFIGYYTENILSSNYGSDLDN